MATSAGRKCVYVSQASLNQTHRGVYFIFLLYVIMFVSVYPTCRISVFESLLAALCHVCQAVVFSRLGLFRMTFGVKYLIFGKLMIMKLVYGEL